MKIFTFLFLLMTGQNALAQYFPLWAIEQFVSESRNYIGRSNINLYSKMIEDGIYIIDKKSTKKMKTELLLSLLKQAEKSKNANSLIYEYFIQNELSEMEELINQSDFIKLREKLIQARNLIKRML